MHDIMAQRHKGEKRFFKDDAVHHIIFPFNYFLPISKRNCRSEFSAQQLENNYFAVVCVIRYVVAVVQGQIASMNEVCTMSAKMLSFA